MIYIASDHRGYELKEKIKLWLKEWGYEFEDLGPDHYDTNDDYPDFMKPLAEKISKDSNAKGIIMGASGQGEAMVANRYKGIRAAVYYGGSQEIIKLSREHNNANVLSLGASFVDDNIKSMIELWLKTEFTNEERHVRRINKIDQ